jgi:CRISPR/Cas system-associated endoribonuclease Cas2
MVKSDIESVKATIAKLITLANNESATENEARVAMNRAERLMAKYQLDQAQILREKIKVGVDVSAATVSAKCYYTGKLENWEYRLGHALSKIFECMSVKGRPYREADTNRKARDMYFIGLPNDLSLTLYFFDYCQDEIGRHMELAYPDEGQRVRNSFAVGMVTRIRQRMKELYKRYKELILSDCTDIVIFKDDAIDREKKNAFPHGTSKSYLHTKNIAEEFRKGMEAGNHVHLSSNLRQVQEGGE